MRITFDPAKNEKNIRERGLSFERAVEFDFDTAVTEPEYRQGEWRFVAKGFLGDRLHVLVFLDFGEDIRVISFRKANQREGRSYEESRRNLE